MQRCERTYGSPPAKIPFWYLLPEFGLHLDQAERRDSIWPTVLALKLAAKIGVPSVVLHYAEQGKPEAYDAGTGVAVLFQSLASMVEIHLGTVKPGDFFALLAEEYWTMLQFLKSQWAEITAFLPDKELLEMRKSPELLTSF